MSGGEGGVHGACGSTVNQVFVAGVWSVRGRVVFSRDTLVWTFDSGPRLPAYTPLLVPKDCLFSGREMLLPDSVQLLRKGHYWRLLKSLIPCQSPIIWHPAPSSLSGPGQNEVRSVCPLTDETFTSLLTPFNHLSVPMFLSIPSISFSNMGKVVRGVSEIKHKGKIANRRREK